MFLYVNLVHILNHFVFNRLGKEVSCNCFNPPFLDVIEQIKIYLYFTYHSYDLTKGIIYYSICCKYRCQFKYMINLFTFRARND